MGSADNKLGRDPFFHRDPGQLSLKGEFISEGIPIMVGVTKDEGLLVTTEFLKQPETFDHFSGNWHKCRTQHMFSKLNSAETTPPADEVEEFYFGSKNLELDLNKHFTNLTNMFTDVMFSAKNHLAIR